MPASCRPESTFVVFPGGAKLLAGRRMLAVLAGVADVVDPLAAQRPRELNSGPCTPSGLHRARSV